MNTGVSQGGRGRGRGRGALAFTDKRPGGDAQHEEKSPSANMESLVWSLPIEPSDIELHPTSEAAKKFSTNKSRMEELVNMLYKRCLTDWKFARCAALVCSRIKDIHVDDASLRTVLLQTIQKDFKAKDKLQQNEPQKFLGCISFLFQILAVMKDANNMHYKPLVPAVKETTIQLLREDASEEELACVAFNLGDVVPILHEYFIYNDQHCIPQRIKEKVITGSGSKETRYQLIHTIEKFAAMRSEKPIPRGSGVYMNPDNQ